MNIKSYFGGKNGIVLFVGFLAIIFVTSFYFKVDKPIFNCDVGSYTFYTYSESSNANIFTVSAKNANTAIKSLSDIKGQSLAFYFDKVDRKTAIEFINSFLKEKGAKLISKEGGSWGKSLYFFSSQINSGVKRKNSRVNIHIVESKDKIIIGSPMIFGSF